MRVNICGILSALLITSSCNREADTKAFDDWYDQTKKEILRQANLPTDSVITESGGENSLSKEYSYHKGKAFKMRGVINGHLRVEIYYSRNGDFEFRKEICDNGTNGFEGITYKSKFYGLSTWRYCNGQLQDQGIRFDNEKVGRWKKWQEDGSITDTTYAPLPPVNSLPHIDHPLL